MNPSDTSFATVADLTAFWKAPESSTRADVLLKLASNRLRLIGERVGVNVDDRVTGSGAYKASIQWVVMEATKRALNTPLDAQPANSIQQTAGPYSENIVFTNPSGDLWFKKSELSDLGLYGDQTLTSLSSTPNSDIYTPYESSLGIYYS